VIYFTYLSDSAKILCSVGLLKIVLAIIRKKQKTYPSSVLNVIRLTLKANFYRLQRTSSQSLYLVERRACNKKLVALSCT
jgi:uncharacterized membrane protein